jgi:hypothetical protein
MTKLPPHLVLTDNDNYCSVCGTSFKRDSRVSISKVFIIHLRKDHPRVIEEIPKVNELKKPPKSVSLPSQDEN